MRLLDTSVEDGKSTVPTGAGTQPFYLDRLLAKGKQMLAELKDLVEKSLFTKVRGFNCITLQARTAMLLVRGQADREKTHAVRNGTCPSNPKEERLSAIRSI